MRGLIGWSLGIVWLSDELDDDVSRSIQSTFSTAEYEGSRVRILRNRRVMFSAEMSSMKERMSHSVVSSVGAATSFAAGGDRRHSLRSSYQYAVIVNGRSGMSLSLKFIGLASNLQLYWHFFSTMIDSFAQITCACLLACLPACLSCTIIVFGRDTSARLFLPSLTLALDLDLKL